MKSLKVLLFNPLESNPAIPSPPKLILNEGGIYPSLGLLQLATMELLRGKHEVKIIDALPENLNYHDIENKIMEEKPDVIGVTLNTLYLGDGYRVLISAKRVSSDIITIVGGPHVTLYPKQTIELKEVDYAVNGEADFVFGEILDRIALGKSVDDLPGVLTKKNLNQPAKQIIVDNLDELPIVNRKLIPYKKYRSILSKSNPITIIMTSRGCVFRCAYCSQAGTKVRKRSTKNVADEIEQCLDLGIKDILFFDELFTIDHKRVKELCEEFISRGLKFRWHVRTRIKDVNREILELMKKAGCRLIQFGIESGTERIQKLMNKNLDLKRVEEVIKMVKDIGILTYGNFMIGSPTETEEEIKKTIDFAIKLDLDFAVFAVTVLLPKTEFYNMAFREGKIKIDFWEEYVKNPLIPIENAYWPDFDKEYLDNLCKEAYLKFYFRQRYIWNYISRVASLQQFISHFRSAVNVFFEFKMK